VPGPTIRCCRSNGKAAAGSDAIFLRNYRRNIHNVVVESGQRINF